MRRSALIFLLILVSAGQLFAQVQLFNLPRGTIYQTLTDLNNDAVPELAVGMPFDSSTVQNAGRVQIISGKDGTIFRDIPGPLNRSNFGYSFATGSDIDNDGVADLCIGAPDLNDTVGVLASVICLSLKDSTFLFEITGTRSFGTSLDFVGDSNFDGLSDLAVGSPKFGSLQPGKVELFSTATKLPIYTYIGAAGEKLGRLVRQIGDLDFDGVPDYIISSDHDSTQIGKVGFFSGKRRELLAEIFGSAAGQLFGSEIELITDLTGDNRSEILLHSVNGVSRVVQGLRGLELYALSSSSVTKLSDINADGLPELVEARIDRSTSNIKLALKIIEARSGLTIGEILLPLSFDLGNLKLFSYPDLDNDGMTEILVLGDAPFAQPIVIAPFVAPEEPEAIEDDEPSIAPISPPTLKSTLRKSKFELHLKVSGSDCERVSIKAHKNIKDVYAKGAVVLVKNLNLKKSQAKIVLKKVKKAAVSLYLGVRCVKGPASNLESVAVKVNLNSLKGTSFNTSINQSKVSWKKVAKDLSILAKLAQSKLSVSKPSPS